MTARTAWSIVGLTILAVITFFLTNNGTEQPLEDTSALPDGYYLSGAVLSTTDASGSVRYELRADRIDHRPSDGSIDLTALQLDYGNNINRWRLSSETGSMPKSNTEISLEGHVITRLLNAASHGATQMATQSLFVDIEQQQASTDDPVTVDFEGGQLTAVGLDMNLANETFILRSQVKGVFEAPTR
ncbi:MAG: LPS export ABC transporter periplasmic protein LptC [Gammaproteobacteria bacterium]